MSAGTTLKLKVRCSLSLSLSPNTHFKLGARAHHSERRHLTARLEPCALAYHPVDLHHTPLVELAVSADHRASLEGDAWADHHTLAHLNPLADQRAWVDGGA